MSHEGIEELSQQRSWNIPFGLACIHAAFLAGQAALPKMEPGGVILNTYVDTGVRLASL